MESSRPRACVYQFRAYADYYQFYLGDSATHAPSDSPDFWNEAAFHRRLAVTPDFIGVGTEVYGTVPVTVEVHTAAPNDDLSSWDQVVEASLEIPTGRLAIDGCLAFSPERSPYRRNGEPPDEYVSPHISVLPGTYRVRVYYGNLDPENESREDHDEQYRVVLWPAPFTEPAILRLKPRPG